MPHLIIEHSSDIKKTAIKALESEILNFMPTIAGANFDSDQTKCRSISFDEYRIGAFDQRTTSFLHVTIKILGGRTAEAKAQLSEKTLFAAKKFFGEAATSPNEKDQVVAIGSEIAEAIAGIPRPHQITLNSDLAGKRCDITVDIVDMEKESFRKIRIQN